MTASRYFGRLWLVALVLAAALYAGCSGSDPDETPTPTPVGTSPTATPSPSPSPVPATATPSAGAVAPLDSPFDIRASETVGLESTDWRLTFNAITGDSRCPVDVTCVWAGEVTASFTATQATGGHLDFEVTLGPLTQARASFDGYRLTLLDVSPEPRNTQQIAPGDYVATVLVEQDSGPPQGQSGVRGVVTAGPQCPVVRPDQPCPDKPYEALIIVTDAGGKEVARTQSAADGSYAVELAPGSYTLRPQKPPDNILPVAQPVDVVISPGEWSTVDISYDTGIR